MTRITVVRKRLRHTKIYYWVASRNDVDDKRWLATTPEDAFQRAITKGESDMISLQALIAAASKGAIR